MIARHKQLHRHAPDEGLIGDCWRTCIACILGLKPTEVPHFFADTWPDKTGERGRDLCNEWLKSRGLTLLELCLDASDKHTAKRFPANVPYILTGKSNNYDGVNHCVIATGLYEQIWDPSPFATAPLAPCVCEVTGSQYYWLEFLVPINLAGENSEGIDRLAVPAL